MRNQLLTCATGRGELSPVLQVDLEQIKARTPMFRACSGPIELWKALERWHLPLRDPSTLQEFMYKGEGREVTSQCPVTVQWKSGMPSFSSSQFYVLVPDHGDNYICLSEVPGIGLSGTLGITRCLEGTHHLMGDLQVFPRILMGPSQSTHTDPSMTGPPRAGDPSVGRGWCHSPS